MWLTMTKQIKPTMKKVMMALDRMGLAPKIQTPAEEIVLGFISRLQNNIVASRMNIHIAEEVSSGDQEEPGAEERRNR